MYVADTACLAGTAVSTLTGICSFMSCAAVGVLIHFDQFIHDGCCLLAAIVDFSCLQDDG
jgi:hypothetical protein